MFGYISYKKLQETAKYSQIYFNYYTNNNTNWTQICSNKSMYQILYHPKLNISTTLVILTFSKKGIAPFGDNEQFYSPAVQSRESDSIKPSSPVALFSLIASSSLLFSALSVFCVYLITIPLYSSFKSLVSTCYSASMTFYMI